MKLVADNLNEQAYRALKASIINKELAPGERLIDTQLAEYFGISRTPIRDAIRKLTEEGLVVTSDKKGYFVFSPSHNDILEIFELREQFDLAAVRKLITQILPSNPEAMEQIRISFEGLDSPSFVQDDESFHETLIRLTGNSRMLVLYKDLSTQTRAFRRLTSNDPDRIRKAKEYHRRIYEGLMHLDLPATEEAVCCHVAYSREDALKDFCK